jgi:NhaA family Na+:H+ antiporter
MSDQGEQRQERLSEPEERGHGGRSHGAARLKAQRSYVARRITLPIQAFIRTEVWSGAVLLAAAIVALVWANSPWDESYADLFGSVLVVDVGLIRIEEDLHHWVNDGLMVVFFFVVGLEIKRELWRGELAGLDKALMPTIAALGGMLAPALIFTLFNYGEESSHGWGIPMATDIAFALGVLALLGRRIPSNLRVFLLALAIADDIGAIMVIAVFYTDSIALDWLAIGVGALLAVVIMRELGVREFIPYFAVGAIVWAAVHESGVHATIAGVVLGLLTPISPYYSRETFRESMRDLLRRFQLAEDTGKHESAEQLLGEMEVLTEGTEAPLDRLERLLHPVSSFIIVPIFALANAGVSLDPDIIEESASSTVTIGVALGLLIGKPLGIFLLSWLAVRTGLAALPRGVRWPQILGAGMLAGVGFTVALFVNELAFDEEVLIDEGKIGILAGSLASGIIGFMVLFLLGRTADDGAVSLEAPDPAATPDPPAD